MDSSRALVQHIAVFGESGSGKTVLLSSFYGATQESQYLKKNLFHLVADDIGQGSRLYRNYLGMRDSARLPEANRFSATPYSFSVKLRTGSKPKAAKSRPFEVLRLVWHDYPGEWFEQNVSGPEEANRRVETFRSLLRSDVALVLVDGQRLLDNAGKEERYLKSLLTNLRNGLLSLESDLLQDGKPLVQFPRIWMLALSKSDLLPKLDVFGFRDILIGKAGDEIDELRKVIAGLVEGGDALSVGEDFVLLSSAKFGTRRIELTERVGLELILPVAAILPFERKVRWAYAKHIPRKVAERLLDGAADLAAAMAGSKAPVGGPLGVLLKLVGSVISKEVIAEMAKLAGDKLKEANAEALARHDYLAATLTRFQLDLDAGEEEQILLRSLR